MVVREDNVLRESVCFSNVYQMLKGQVQVYLYKIFRFVTYRYTEDTAAGVSGLLCQNLPKELRC